MTHQQAYEKIRAWLTRPGATRSYHSGMRVCVYRAQDGNRCAIGALMSEQVIAEASSRYCGVERLLESSPAVARELSGLTLHFMEDMQVIHDNVDHWDEQGFTKFGLRKLDETAKSYGCIPVPTDEIVKAP